MTPPPSPSLRQLPAGIWVLGLVSLLMDVSSEMIHSLLPLFMVTALGTSVWAQMRTMRPNSRTSTRAP